MSLPPLAISLVAFITLVAPAGAAQVPTAAPADTPPGVVVESVDPRSPLHTAGLRVGDRLLVSQAVNGTARPITSVFEWIRAVTEDSPRGNVRLEVEREGRTESLDVPPGSWDAQVRPALAPPLLPDYLEADRRITRGDLDDGAGRLAALARATPDASLRFWLRWRIGQTWDRASKYDAACAAYRAALAEAPDDTTRALAWDGLGSCHEEQSLFEEAEDGYSTALRLRRAAGTKSLAVARTLRDLGRVLSDWNKLDQAKAPLAEALAIQQELAPESLAIAGTLNQSAIVAAQRGDLPEAEALFRRAAALQEKLAPGGVDLARSWNNLGIVAFQRGQLEAAEDYYRRALAVHSTIEPAGLEVATALSNLGLVARERGDLDGAEDYAVQAMTIEERLRPGSLDLAASLHSLATLLHDRGALEGAEKRYRAALRIETRLAPGGRSLASTLNNLGEVMRDRGRLAEAEGLFRQALVLWRTLAPHGLEAAETLDGLADVQLRRGRLAASRRSYTEAAAIQESLAPESAALATSYHGLGRVAQREGHLVPAVEDFRRALRVLEAQVDRVGGSPEAKASFRARFHGFYHDAVAALVALRRPDEAFQVLERSRARTLLAMLAERELALSADMPAEVDAARRALAAKYDEVQQRLVGLDARRDRATIDEVQVELRRVREERDRMAMEVRRRSPRLAELRYPQPLDAAGARQSLDPGTVVLSFSVGERATIVFVLTAAGLHATTVPMGHDAVRDAVEGFRKLVLETRSASEGNPRWAALLRAGRQLYRDLIGPAEATLARSARVLIVPDGPLHGLPFAALVRDRTTPSDGRDWQYFAEWKPLHLAASASVYAELRKARRGEDPKGEPETLVAFGDPSRGSRPAAPAARAVPVSEDPSKDASGWRALPASRLEVEAITRLFGKRATPYVGAEATEERAKTIGARARYLHFATHARLDDRTPLNSALLLAAPAAKGGENGLLQAWEIMESLHLDADLVVLSTCDSGLGKELRGEGLLGLSRAFQFAGARSVLASLWEVADETTAYLMARFYANLRDGLSKDQALRAAQRELITRPLGAPGGAKDVSAPYYWAVFQLMGDWK